ncbi:hypothetical protein BH11BAC6_BH11BAC6_00260 [soil metagenome]
MQYSIENLQHFFNDEFGDYALCFTCDFHFKEPHELVIRDYPVSTHLIQQFIKEKKPAFNTYVCKVRGYLDTWGPQTGLTYEALCEEAQQLFYQYTIEYLQQAEWVQKIYENENLQHTQVENFNKTGSVKTKGLQSVAPVIKKETTRVVQFKNKLQHALREITLELYPEIMEVGTGDIKELHRLYTDNVLKIQEALNRYMEIIKISKQ